jgi:hypothetical protein
VIAGIFCFSKGGTFHDSQKIAQGIPGILGLMAFSPTTARPLNELAEVLLRSPNSLSQGERELIATCPQRTIVTPVRTPMAEPPHTISAEMKT